MLQVTDNTENSTPRPVLLLKKHGVSMRGIARGLDKGLDTVRDTLNPDKAGNVGHKSVMAIRGRIEDLLRAAGEDVSDLWHEYDDEDAA